MNNEAAQSLLERALSSESQGIAHLLIDSAHRLDESINTEQVKRQWLDQWMLREYQAMMKAGNNE